MWGLGQGRRRDILGMAPSWRWRGYRTTMTIGYLNGSHIARTRGASAMRRAGEAFPRFPYRCFANQGLLHSCRSADLPEVSVKHKEVTVALAPPLAPLGLLSTELAPKGILPWRFHEFTIQLIFSLDGCYCNNYRALAKLSPAGSAKEHMSEQDLAKLHQILYSYK